jgi:phosphoribosyl 1,2-cyclic phosphate phosphodiesterase
MAIDGVCYTHNHADHIFGIDDLRRFNAVMEQSLDLFAEPRVCDWFRKTFEYIFDAQKNINKSFVPQLVLRNIEPGEAFDLHGGRWTPLRLMHGRLPILGFRVDYADQSLAYCTDVSRIPPETYPLLQDLDVLVLDGLRYRHRPTPLTVDQALEIMDQVKPGRGYLTHIAHDIRHAELEPRLPEHVFLAFDGLTVAMGD